MINMRKRKIIEEKANELLKSLGIDEIPVPLEKIAEKLGIIIEEEVFEGELAGVLLRDINGAIIGVNAAHPETRKRFTIAHELGHFILHKGDPVHIDRGFRVNFRDKKSSMAIDFEEIEANAFAAALLMPEKKLRAVIKKKIKQGIDLENSEELEKIAEEFKVSQQALIIRLMKLEIIEELGLV
jgi:Zn-dependent peptidase ImmA (M78 family)